MKTDEIIGLTAGLLTSAALLPQLFTTLKKKKATEVSWFMFVVMLGGNALWAYYGFRKSDPPIIGTNIFSLILNATMLFLKYRYKDNK